MIPFHALMFHLRLIVEGPCFITSDDSLQGLFLLCETDQGVSWKCQGGFACAQA